MNLIRNRRVRTALIAGVSLAVVAAIGIGVANATTSTNSRWVTATAKTADVTQAYVATGSITRKNTVKAAFAAEGPLTAVKVSVGSNVVAGQVLATLSTRSLKLAVLEAETSVARAELTLYNARHPNSSSSASSSSRSSSSATSVSKSSVSKKAAKPKTPSLATVTFDLAALNAAVKRVGDAVSSEASACAPIMAWVNDEASSASVSKASSSSKGSSDDSGSEAKAGDSAESTSDPSSEASTTSTKVKTSTAGNDPTDKELKACASARVELTNSNAGLQKVMASVNAAATGTPANSGSSPSRPSSGSSSVKVSASAVASAKASLLEANQGLLAAKDDLGEAELLAPISGTVGAVGLSKGDAASAGTITIIGKGSAVVSIEVPLKTRGSIALGASAKVTPAGSLTPLDGKVTNISLLETSGTSGDSPTYTTKISVTDPDQRLASGAKASVAIPVKSVTGAVTVPASAVTPTGTGTATLSVLAVGAETPSKVEVKTGAVGGGLVEITEGLTAGQVVVLADNTADLPANATRTSNRGITSSSSSSSTTRTSTTTNSSAPKPSAQATR